MTTYLENNSTTNDFIIQKIDKSALAKHLLGFRESINKELASMVLKPKSYEHLYEKGYIIL